MTIAERRIADADDYFKAQRRSAEREQILEMSLRGSMTSPITRAVRRENHESLIEALAALPQQYRDAIRLVRFEGHSYAEAAKVLGKSEGAVSQSLVRALKALRELLEDTGRQTRWEL